MAEYVIVVQEEDEEVRDGCVYVLEPHTPFLSKRRESLFWKKIGEERCETIACAELPFEALMLFMKKARRVSRKRICLCTLSRDGESSEGWRVLTGSSKSGEPGSTMTEDEKLHFEEARILAEEISRRNRDAIPDMEDELITVDEFEDIIRGERPGSPD